MGVIKPLAPRYGRLTVIERLSVDRVLCRCDCGTERTFDVGSVRGGHSKSCGCLQNEVTVARNKQGLGAKHGLSQSKLFHIWKAMKSRCCDPNHKQYANYGGRGITVCDAWLENFLNFYSDIGWSRPSDEYSLDRINNDGPYSPDNCRWATRDQQNRNKTTTLFFTFNGETLALMDWCERYEASYSRVLYRVKRMKWPIEKALTTPFISQEENKGKRKDSRMVMYEGKEIALITLCSNLKLDHQMVYYRVLRGWDLERAITQPLGKNRSHPRHKNVD